MFTRLIVSENRLGVNTKNALKNVFGFSSHFKRMLESECEYGTLLLLLTIIKKAIAYNDKFI